MISRLPPGASAAVGGLNPREKQRRESRRLALVLSATALGPELIERAARMRCETKQLMPANSLSLCRGHVACRGCICLPCCCAQPMTQGAVFHASHATVLARAQRRHGSTAEHSSRRCSDVSSPATNHWHLVRGAAFMATATVAQHTPPTMMLGKQLVR